MRLIDADVLIAALETQPNYQIVLPKGLADTIQSIIANHHNMIVKVINKQPTAFDVKKVVEQLDDEICLNPINDYEMGNNRAMHAAIELLEKVGGIDGN